MDELRACLCLKDSWAGLDKTVPFILALIGNPVERDREGR